MHTKVLHFVEKLGKQKAVKTIDFLENTSKMENNTSTLFDDSLCNFDDE